MYILDTNICIYIINKKPESVFKKLHEIRDKVIGVSSITLGELQFGIENSESKTLNQNALNKFLSPLNIFSFDQGAARAYGSLRQSLELRGRPIGAMDLLIAAHTISLEFTLVTNNLREFARIEDLSVENWIK